MLNIFGRMAAVLMLIPFSSSSVLAACDYCNPTIRLDAVAAQCFSDQVESDLTRVRSEGRGFLLVDLTGCVVDKGRGLPDAGSDLQNHAPVDTSFIADEAGLLCIKAELATKSPTDLDPSIELDLSGCK